MAARAATATAEELHAALAAVDAGTLSDGDMDPGLLRALDALEAYAVVRSGDTEDGARRLAWLALEAVDDQHPAALEDFLGGPEMAASFAAIRTELAPFG
ncbi:hypothetical protein [Microbacterium gorillae]|uniref:hypothetical protein n=1 Tax=Microbacterium gorillae TaxID=1231063 RepID=UPI000AC875E1|nr:hypothetical protein [Microbacterium gorillae]